MLGALAAGGAAVALTGCALVTGPCAVERGPVTVLRCERGGVILLLYPPATIEATRDVIAAMPPPVWIQLRPGEGP
jgi:hypothetical protein